MLKKVDIDFLFVMEHEDREGDAISRIVDNLRSQGRSCVVLSSEFHGHRLRRFNPLCVVLPFAISTQRWPMNLLYQLFGGKADFVSLNWEQLLSEANKEFKRPQDDFVKKSIRHLAWTENFSDFLSESGVKPGNVRVIGNPLTQLLYESSQNCDAIAENLFSEFGLDKSKNLVFFPMNYGWAFFGDSTLEAKIALGYNRDVAFEYRDYSKRCLESFCKFLSDLVRESDYNIVVRPHPSISIEQYREVFSAYAPELIERVLLTKKYTIKEWIVISDIVGSSWSTSVWDAANIGKPHFLFTPFDRPSWLDTWWNNLVPNISTISEFSGIANSTLKDFVKPNDIISDVAFWLSEPQAQSSSFDLQNNPKVKKLHLLYEFRCAMREASMRYFGGWKVKEGMKRDYFEFFVDAY